MRTEEGSDTEESGDVVNVGPIGFAEGLDGVRLDEFFKKTLKTDVSGHYLDFLQNQGKTGEE